MAKRKSGAAQVVKPWEPSARDLDIYADVVNGDMTYEQIGEKFGLSKQRIHQLAHQVDQWYIPQMMGKIREIKVRQTASLDRIFRKAMAGFEASRRDSIESIEKESGSGDESETETTIKRKTNAGSPAFLSEARGALADIRKIWGADALVASDDDEEFRFSGMPRDEAIQKYAESQIQRYKALINRN